MKQTTFLGFLLLLSVSFSASITSLKAEETFSPGALGMKVPVLTHPKERDKYVGRLIALRGTVSDTKITRINGVEVKADTTLRGQEAYAVGILSKWTITEDAIRRSAAIAGPLPNDGPGDKYILYFDLSGRIAEARPIPTK